LSVQACVKCFLKVLLDAGRVSFRHREKEEPHARHSGSLAGKKGGKARSEKLSLSTDEKSPRKLPEPDGQGAK